MDGYAEDFAEMALRLNDEPSVQETVERVLEYALKAVNCDYAGVIFVTKKDRVETIAATDPLVAELDKFQVELGEGPDIDVISDVRTTIVSDTGNDERWPKWGRVAADHGVRSLLAVRLYTSSDTIGTLNLYDADRDHFDHDDQAVAHVLARHAAIALANARNTEHLWQAIDARKLIGQAQGILMERYHLSADQAFAVLLRYSQDKNIKLRKVAERLIDTRDLPN